MRLRYMLMIAFVFAAFGISPAFAQATAANTGSFQGTSPPQPDPGPVSTATSAPQQDVSPAYQLPQQYQQKFNTMTAEQRQALIQQAYKNWNTMSATDKRKMYEAANAKFYQLSPSGQDALKRQALQQWRSMSADEQQQLKDSFGLEGDLELTDAEKQLQ